MKKTLIVLMLVLVLVMAMVVPAVAQEVVKEGSFRASVSVTEKISITITDSGNDGLSFGALAPGATTIGEAGQSPPNQPAVQVSVSPETNVNLSIRLRASRDFTNETGATIGIGNATWWTEGEPALAKALTTTDTEIDTTLAGQMRVFTIYHWLTVPSNAPGGTYTTDFIYSAVRR